MPWSGPASRILLATSENLRVVAEAADGEQAIEQYARLRPDLLIMDLSMPGIGGLETISRIVRRHAEARILVFSVHHEQVYVERALNAGAQGYITKNSAPETLTDAIHAIIRGERYVESGLVKTRQTANGRADCRRVVANFSAREFEIFKMLAQGMTVHKIADRICLGYKTVANYATQIKKKLQIDSLAELARIAEELGITER